MTSSADKPDLEAKRRAGLISIRVLAVITLLMLALAAWLFWVDQRVFVIGEQAEAVVASKREVKGRPQSGSGYSVPSFYVHYRFQAPDAAMVYHKQAVSRALYERLQIGDRTPVWFDASDPKISYIDRVARWNAIICLLIALGFAAGTGYLIHYQRRIGRE